MIPKKIHYIWIGNSQKPDIVHKCINSWKHYLPDYEIFEWGNEAVKSVELPYVQEAFKCQKWAFVSDYLRLKALYEHGGFYFDTDLEVTNQLDSFLDLDFFCGFEDYNGNSGECYLMTALIASKPNNPIIKGLMDEYQIEKFILEDGSLNVKTNVKRMSEYFSQKFNFQGSTNPEAQSILNERCKIFPSYFFSTPQINKINYSRHHYDGSWHDNFKRKTIFKLFSYKVVLFFRNKTNKPFNVYSYGNEQLLAKFFLFKKVCLTIVKISQ